MKYNKIFYYCIMKITIKKKIYKNKTHKNKNHYTNNNLKGGKNFINYLFMSDEIDSDDCNSENEFDETELKSKMSHCDDILTQWIQNTNENDGMHLYFIKQDIDQQEIKQENDKKWFQGFHGDYIQKQYKLNFNDYIKQRMGTNSLCLNGQNKENMDNCIESLEDIQLKDLECIKQRIQKNNKINKYLLEWKNVQNQNIQKKEKELQDKIDEMKINIEIEKEKMEKHNDNVEELFQKNYNFNEIIKKYISSNPDFEELKNIDTNIFTINEKLMNYIEFILAQKSSIPNFDIVID